MRSILLHLYSKLLNQPHPLMVHWVIMKISKLSMSYILGRLAAGSASERLSVWIVYITCLRNQHENDIHIWYGMIWYDVWYRIVVWYIVSYQLTSFHIISYHMGMIWYDIWYRIVIWHEMISYGIVSYHIISYHVSYITSRHVTSHHNHITSYHIIYHTTRVRVVLGTSCPDPISSHILLGV